MKWKTPTIILLLLFILIFIPPFILGNIYILRAEYSQYSNISSQYYEKASNLLFWRTDLLEKSGLSENSDSNRKILLLFKAQKKGKLGFDGLLALGDEYIKKGHYDQAIQAWVDIYILKTQNILLVGERLAKAYHQQKSYIKEIHVLREWLALDSTNPVASEMLGILLASDADPEAVKWLTIAASNSTFKQSRLNQLISAFSVSGSSFANRLIYCGQSLAEIGEWNLAEKAFQKATIVDPAAAFSWGWLGIARQHNKSGPDLVLLEKALKMDPVNASIQSLMGIYWQQKGDYFRAEKFFKSAATLDPQNPNWWIAVGNTAVHNNLTEALSSYIKAVNLDPSTDEYWFALASFCVENDVYIQDYGLDAALHAYAINPTNPENMDILGQVQMEVGQLSLAETMFSRAVSTSTQESMKTKYQFHLGLLYLKMYRLDDAKKELENIIRKDPNGNYGNQAKILSERYFP